MAAHVEMYTTMSCAFCIRAKRLLAQKGITDVEEIDVTFDRSGMVQRTGGASTVPQIFVDGHHVGGFDGLVALEREGRLDELLGVTAEQ